MGILFEKGAVASCERIHNVSYNVNNAIAVCIRHDVHEVRCIWLAEQQGAQLK